ncbi:MULTISPECIES: squalene synthase HpnC [Acetobacter]|uniref:Squalene synthase HpnC n=2 Tax=Acetobacter TaxID=434 RepID=A0AAN1PJH1_9PROT|nr:MULTISPECIES: squalene synthase HpnC [Acetobacter]ASL39163.1 squalene synthase HpnC [Acetobacter oryzifermentans]AXN01287.1 squalene synthase HpnC [Acetobacter pomorum]KAA8395080.1 squalene synthase HpnC [Acetobacter sp. DmW_125128]KAA8395518.1 squalene synthase HpnC [Acetobacter sp. DmW_125124]KAA8399869.1 squalene synthase HpnC [Acetobacter sp. DmW_125127]
MTNTTSVWGTVDVSSGKGASDENFPVGSLLISKKLRPHVHAYYDYARVIDDIADSETLAPDDKITRLNAMEEVLLGKRDPINRPDAQSAATLRRSLLQTHVPFETATDLLIAFRNDSRGHVYQTWDDLLQYCRYSANPVGRYLIGLHEESSAAFAPSDALCTSLQILNHLQDCSGDLKRLKRCYIPADMMQRCGTSQQDLLAGSSSPALRRVFNTMLDGVDALNQQASALAAHIRDRRFRMECAAIVELAHCLTRRLRREDPLAGRVALRRADGMHAAIAALRAWA